MTERYAWYAMVIPSLFFPLLPLASYIAPPTLLTCYSCLSAAWTRLEEQKAPADGSIGRLHWFNDSPFLNLPGDSLAPFSSARTPFYWHTRITALPITTSCRPWQARPSPHQPNASPSLTCSSVGVRQWACLLRSYMYASAGSMELDTQCHGRFLSIYTWLIS